MVTLKNEFKGRGEVKGYNFKQIKATKKGFIYEKTSEMNTVSYEVFKYKENKQFNCVSYPTSKAFGLWAWEVDSLERAEEIYSQKILGGIL